jgi:hypothetical protein
VWWTVNTNYVRLFVQESVMNRRKFLQWLGVGAVGAAVAPSVLLSEGPACVTAPTAYTTGKEAIISGYANYANFSSFALAAAIDESVQNAAIELGKAHSFGIRELVKHAEVSFS